ncbi:MAG: TolC family protein [Elusimicrobiota bacterium]
MLCCRISPVNARATDPGSNARILKIEEFIKEAVRNDGTFEEILLDGMSLKYVKALKIPADDLLLSVKSQYELNIEDNDGAPRLIIGLNRLFPYTGTDISAEYTTAPSISLDKNSSEITLLISQPIAENAFGKATVLLDKITGLETDITGHQVVEAYEDYLAAVITAYYNWFSAYENLKIGEISYKKNISLLDNIKKRRENNIALPIDVNKIEIQSLAKKEDLIRLQERYDNIHNFIRQAVRSGTDEVLQPSDPFMFENREIAFEDDFSTFKHTSRTYRILGILEEKSSLEVAKDANELLPSADLLFGYAVEGDDITLKDRQQTVYAGISMTWPLPGQKERAEYETSKIAHRKIKVSNDNKYLELETDLRNLFQQIEREKKLILIAEKKIRLAESILEDETVNYAYGKVSLNDFIDAANRVDENRFNKILHSVQLKILTTEWMRMTDRLISEKDIKSISE